MRRKREHTGNERLLWDRAIEIRQPLSSSELSSDLNNQTHYNAIYDQKDIQGEERRRGNDKKCKSVPKYWTL